MVPLRLVPAHLGEGATSKLHNRPAVRANRELEFFTPLLGPHRSRPISPQDLSIHSTINDELVHHVRTRLALQSRRAKVPSKPHSSI